MELPWDLPVENGIGNGAYVVGNAAYVIQQIVHEHLLIGWLSDVDGHQSLCCVAIGRAPHWVVVVEDTTAVPVVNSNWKQISTTQRGSIAFRWRPFVRFGCFKLV